MLNRKQSPIEDAKLRLHDNTDTNLSEQIMAARYCHQAAVSRSAF
jgi:hypothetical protein